MRTEVIGSATPWVRIYALCEYPDLAPRYVGKTIQWLHERHKAHIRLAKVSPLPKLPVHRWLRKQIDSNSRLVIKLLENVSDADIWAEREAFWIAKLRSDGADLLNLTDGGEGGHGRVTTDEHRGRIAKALKTGSSFSCETCHTIFWRKLSAIKKGNCRFCSRICYKTSLRGVSRPVPDACTQRGLAAAAAEKRNRITCKRGHLLSGENLFLNTKGSRGCKECRKIHKAAYHNRRAANG